MFKPKLMVLIPTSFYFLVNWSSSKSLALNDAFNKAARRLCAYILSIYSIYKYILFWWRWKWCTLCYLCHPEANFSAADGVRSAEWNPCHTHNRKSNSCRVPGCSVIWFVCARACVRAFRCCGAFRSGHTHRVHGGYCVRADWSDLTHPARDDRRDPGQRRGSEPPAVAVRLHHQNPETSVPAGTGLGPGVSASLSLCRVRIQRLLITFL